MRRRRIPSPFWSSMRGTCGRGRVVRRTACVVLMLTTALPCSSTRRVKSGSSRCACAERQKAASHRAARALIVLIYGLLKFLWTTILNCIGDALHARRGRLAHDGHHMVRHLARVDVDRAEARQAGA